MKNKKVTKRKRRGRSELPKDGTERGKCREVTLPRVTSIEIPDLETNDGE